MILQIWASQHLLLTSYPIVIMLWQEGLININKFIYTLYSMSKVLGIGCLHLKAQLSRKELEDSWNRVDTFHGVITYKLRISGREPPKPWT